MRSFAGIALQPYQGTPVAIPVQSGANLTNVVVPINLIWSFYGASTTNFTVGVYVDLGGKAAASRLGSVRSIYIDNTNSNVSVYVRAPDTLYTVVCEPNSEGWFPWFGNLNQFQVYGLGFVTGSIPTTNLIFSNLPVIPSLCPEIQTAVALWLASAVVSRGTGQQNQNFGIPALGDQTDTRPANIVATGVFGNNMFGSPYPSGFIYITNAFVWVVTQAGLANTYDFQLESFDGVSTIQIFPYIAPGTGLVPATIQAQAMNLKLDATLTYRLRVISMSTAFFASAGYIYTTNPN